MSSDLLVVSPEDILGEVAQTMRDRDTGSAVVALDGRADRDPDVARSAACVRRPRPAEPRARREWMTAEPVTVPSSTRVEVALSLMNEHGVDQMPVVDGRRPVGMLGFRQAARQARGRGIGLGF